MRKAGRRLANGRAGSEEVGGVLAWKVNQSKDISKGKAVSITRREQKLCLGGEGGGMQ